MLQVHTASTIAEAHLVRGALDAEGIGSELRNEHLTADVGVRAPVEELRVTIWVDEADAARATAVLQAASRDAETTSADSGAPSTEAAQAVMGDLFVAADSLVHAPHNGDRLDEVRGLAATVVATPPPFGVEGATWDTIASLASTLTGGAEDADEDDVRVRARALRDFLRTYV